MRKVPAAADRIGEALWLIRQNVPGVRGSITATSDGLLIAHDVRDLEPTQIAALVAAMHAVAVRATLSTQCGQFKEVITRGSDGYLAVYAAGNAAIVAVLGTTDLNVAMLNYQARTMIERVAEHSAAFGRRPGTDPLATPGTPGTAAAPAATEPTGSTEAGPLPTRRPRGE
jgi:predicted regulator of Ras-like GTPase activity (Roadblock/LC7/MglB family)